MEWQITCPIQLLGKIPAENIFCQLFFFGGGGCGFHQIVGGQQGIAAGLEFLQRRRNLVDGEKRDPGFIVSGDVETGQPRRIREKKGKSFVVVFRLEQERFSEAEELFFLFGLLGLFFVILIVTFPMTSARLNNGRRKGAIRFFIEMNAGQRASESPP